MKKDVADKWVAALRSGKFQQGKTYLSQDGKFCCLGVLCEVLQIPKVTISGDRVAYGLPPYGVNVLPDDAKIIAKMASTNGDRGLGKTDLWQLNDVDNYTFDQIADIIEKEWETL